MDTLTHSRLTSEVFDSNENCYNICEGKPLGLHSDFFMTICLDLTFFLTLMLLQSS